MIEITNPLGKRTYLATAAIASVTEAGTSSQWHGIKCHVKCFDGTVLECRDTARQIAEKIAKEQP